jgi:deoxyribonuclease V
MLLAVDVAYDGTRGTAAGVLFERWDSPAAAREMVVAIDGVAEYEPGQFYRRELPCIQALLQALAQPVEVIVIDGYVELGAEAAPGLGRHLWDTLGGTTPVIGVAKTEFRGTPETARLLRGGSTRPLFVSAIGLALDEAKRHIASMHGAHRLPDLLKAADRLCRGQAATVRP